MSIIINNNPNPFIFKYNQQNCKFVYWDENLVWPDLDKKYFYVRPDNDDTLVYDFKFQTPRVGTKQIKYSFDGDTWTQYSTPISLQAGQVIYLASDTSIAFSAVDSWNRLNSKGLSLLNNSTFSVGGNVMSLFSNAYSLPDMALENFLLNSSVKDASGIIFPTTTSQYCYTYMFQGCTSLVNAPILPATVMHFYSYAFMFSGCSSLVNAPSLPATTISRECYSYMFWNCTSLTSIPELPATTLDNACYRNLFDGCTSLKFSETQTEECPNQYRIPIEGTGVDQSGVALSFMFNNTSGTFTASPSINTTYYTNATVI